MWRHYLDVITHDLFNWHEILFPWFVVYSSTILTLQIVGKEFIFAFLSRKFMQK